MPIAINDLIATELADAKAALFDFSMHRGGTFLENPSINFHVNGPDSKAPEILKVMLDAFINFNITDAQFDIVRDEGKRNYINQLKRPSSILLDIYHFTFDSAKYSVVQRRKALMRATRDDLIQFVRRVRDTAYLKLHAEGNFYIEEISRYGSFWWNISYDKVQACTSISIPSSKSVVAKL